MDGTNHLSHSTNRVLSVRTLGFALYALVQITVWVKIYAGVFQIQLERFACAVRTILDTERQLK